MFGERGQKGEPAPPGIQGVMGIPGINKKHGSPGPIGPRGDPHGKVSLEGFLPESLFCEKAFITKCHKSKEIFWKAS